MTLFPVMGTALIRAISVAKKCPRGPLLAVATENREKIPEGLIVHEVSVPRHPFGRLDSFEK
jgi:hypothetical protein